ncbi:hypothetical protein DL768_000035 [Monosporascus sp. mg162]|nr:hypothetical protein DL768_000035 [Monosporascus sp. mg162]
MMSLRITQLYDCKDDVFHTDDILLSPDGGKAGKQDGGTFLAFQRGSRPDADTRLARERGERTAAELRVHQLQLELQNDVSIVAQGQGPNLEPAGWESFPRRPALPTPPTARNGQPPRHDASNWTSEAGRAVVGHKPFLFDQIFDERVGRMSEQVINWSLQMLGLCDNGNPATEAGGSDWNKEFSAGLGLYGPFGSSKTHTMECVIDAVISVMLDVADTGECSNTTSGRQVGGKAKIELTAAQVYPGGLEDLLPTGRRKRNRLHGDYSQQPRRASSGQWPFNDNITAVHVAETRGEARKLLEQAAAKCKTSHTGTNESSSRSHPLYALRRDRFTVVPVDLGGSGRAYRVGAVDGLSEEKKSEIRQEGPAINTELPRSIAAIHTLMEKKNGKARASVTWRDGALVKVLRSTLEPAVGPSYSGGGWQLYSALYHRSRRGRFERSSRYDGIRRQGGTTVGE